MRRLLFANVILLFSLLLCTGTAIAEESLSKKLGLKIKTVYLDPSYGGKENGPRLSKGKLGKNVTLEIAQEIKAILEAQGFAVSLSRSEDKSVPLDIRAFQAKSRQSDLYIGIKVTEAKKDCIRVFTEPKPARKHPVTSDKTDDPSKGLNDIFVTLRADNRHDESLSIAGIISKKLIESDIIGCIQLLRSFDYVLLNTSMPAVTVDFAISDSHKNQPYILDTDVENSLVQLLSDAIKEYADDRTPKVYPKTER